MAEGIAVVRVIQEVLQEIEENKEVDKIEMPEKAMSLEELGIVRLEWNLDDKVMTEIAKAAIEFQR